MGDIVPLATGRIASMAASAIDKVRALEAEALKFPQVDIPIDHALHAGMYARTAHVPAGALITGVYIRVPTLLIVAGQALIYVGEDAPLRVRGYTVLAAAGGRKQAFIAETDISITMVFPTKARTVAEAEAEFTDEPHLLQRSDVCPV